MPTELAEIKSLAKLRSLMKKHGVHALAFKRLAPNDNSKNQPYLGHDYSALQILPFDQVVADKSRTDSKRDRYKAKLDFSWLDDNGALHAAPNAQLILYPKYPEVRLSGFLLGARSAPSRYMTSREAGRVLFLGVTDDRRIIAHVIGPENPVAREIEAFDGNEAAGVFSFVFRTETSSSTKKQLLSKLHEISEMGWVTSRKMGANGVTTPYKAPNGGGYTLEALLGISPNGVNEPDYLGWEIKQHTATGLDKPLSGGAITLMTPEPDGGFYKSAGVTSFVRQYGYADTSGKHDRMNFGGIHRFGQTTKITGLRLDLSGYNTETGKIDDVNGGLSLVAADGTIAALWQFGSMLEKWNRKHALAAYVPSERDAATNRYRYGHVVALGQETNFGLFLSAVAQGLVYYDPGIKLENASSRQPKTKRRSQFRIRPSNLGGLYRLVEIADMKSGRTTALRPTGQ